MTCPAGQVRPMSGERTVTFGAACAACPLRELCTTSRDGRSMTIHPHDGLCAPPARRPAPRSSSGPTRPGRTSSGPSPGLRRRTAGGSGCAISALPKMMPGCIPGARPEPADPAQGRADALGRGLGPGLTGQDRPARCPGGQDSRDRAPPERLQVRCRASHGQGQPGQPSHSRSAHRGAARGVGLIQRRPRVTSRWPPLVMAMPSARTPPRTPATAWSRSSAQPGSSSCR